MIETLERPDHGPDTGEKANIGSMLLDMGRLAPDEVSQIVQFQKEKGIRFGEAALQLGLANITDIDQVLARQFNYRCLPQEQIHYPKELEAAYAPSTVYVAALKRLRSQLMNRWFAHGHKFLPVIGISAGDGTSTFVANLAVLFSQLGQRTLAVDADLRSHTLSTIFRISEKKGLSDVLAGRERKLRPVVLEHFADLSVLGAGTPPPNPDELLGHPDFKALVHEHAQHYDSIFYDAAPLCKAGDVMEIAAATGCALVLVRKNHTKVADLEYANKELRANGVTVVGTVMIEF
jgi:chain length determinant protein tyrosine kinase EpsG